MRMYDIIHNKRNGIALTNDEIRFFINGYLNGSIPDYQASALLMAICFNGMNEHETASLTTEMAASGDQIDLSSIKGVTIDKHSTGGVGDKTTLIVAPIVAACGGYLAKMSGRGLGHTGGTVDKLESIPGFKTELTSDEFLKQVNDIGICVVGQSANLAPADKKLYALRDVTATIESIPLIASSIMSKKIAAGSSCIVLDVKVGSGAFMKTEDEAKILAQKMVDIGYSVGRKTAAVITNMDIPLGNAIGNSLEVIEAALVLKGGGEKDLIEVCIALASTMLHLCTGKDIAECEQMALNSITSGTAFSKLREMVKAQGGDVSVLDNTDLFDKASCISEIASEATGYISSMDTEKIGISSVILGAGRKTKDDPIDYAAGIILKAKTGDFVKKGDVIAVFHSSDMNKTLNAKKVFFDAVSFSKTSIETPKLVYNTISKQSF